MKRIERSRLEVPDHTSGTNEGKGTNAPVERQEDRRAPEHKQRQARATARVGRSAAQALVENHSGDHSDADEGGHQGRADRQEKQQSGVENVLNL
ncbi:MAG: hypothetical protein M3371_13800 [Acidobacteriota bacterium]|nr:hypothetical protein [Acidobacteriota bacterium]